MKTKKYIFCGIIVFVAVWCRVSGQSEGNECYAMSCTDCFQAGPKCAWCASPDFEGGEWERCQNVRKFGKSCRKNQLFTTNLTPDLQENDIEENLVSISKVNLNLRPNSSVSFPVSVLVPRDNRRKKENVMIIGWRSGKKPIDLHIDSECEKGKRKGHKFACKKVKKGEKITFEITAHLKSCSAKKGNYKLFVKIGKAKKIIQVKAKYICECKVIDNKKRNKKCSFNSKRNFGEGNCVLQGTVTEEVPPEPETINVNIDCPFSEEESMNLCRRNGGEICGGNGKCSCGLCTCNMLFYGDNCECSDHTCPRFKGVLCGGPSKGTCNCGKCSCTENYTGNNCGCPMTNSTCRATDGSVCNNKGYCICGECRCTQGYKGSTCETCPECVPSCEQYKQCAECLVVAGHTMPRSMCRAVCKGSIPEFSVMEKIPETGTGEVCYHVGQDGCPLNFKLTKGPTDYSFVNLQIEKRTACRTSQKCRSDDHCLASNGAVCNNKGSCNCGYCECQSGFIGPSCEDCSDCDDLCDQYRDCVNCVAFRSGVLSRSQCDEDCSSIRPSIRMVNTMIGDLGKSCQFRDPKDDCIINYDVKYDKNGQLSINVLNQRVGCNGGMNLWT